VVRNLYLSVDPAQRGWASTESNYSDTVPLGGPMRALAVGIVVRSRDATVEEGDFLYGWFGWQDYSLADRSKILTRATLPLPLSAFASVLGINGLTAYLALTGCGRPRPGDRLLVSTAAGSVGSFVGQIGQKLGCHTIGLTGSEDKVGRCLNRFGYHEAYNYKTVDLAAQLAQSAPEGLDILYDNTGGAILDTALRQMRVGGRVVQCGTAAIASWMPPPVGPRNEREVLTRRLTWSGFVIFDHQAALPAAMATLSAWCQQGDLVYDEHVSDGIQHAPAAIAELYAGDNQGKRLIYIG
jgi:NADPH-dependent curcumin reductase CurA